MQFKRTLPLIIVAMAALIPASAPADDMCPCGSGPQSECHCETADSIAINGFSPVSYFTQGRAVRGSADFAVIHDGMTYHLTSAAEQRLFRANPDRYAPAYDGWCALGISLNQRFPIDPENFKIVDSRLLLFLRDETHDALEMWNDGDERQQLMSADTNWREMEQMNQ